MLSTRIISHASTINERKNGQRSEFRRITREMQAVDPVELARRILPPEAPMSWSYLDITATNESQHKPHRTRSLRSPVKNQAYLSPLGGGITSVR